MAKQSQIDRAIAQLEGEMAVLQMAIDRLKAQRLPVKTKTPKPKRTTERYKVVEPEDVRNVSRI